MQRHDTRHASWRELLAAPPPGSHVVQIYDRHDFVAEAVAYFAAEGLRRREAVILNGTAEHLAAARKRLASLGADVDRAVRDGQIMTLDADTLATEIPGLADEEIELLLERIIQRARGPFEGVRWWGETAGTLYYRGDCERALLAEKLSTRAAERQGTTIFCSFLCDKFEPQGYGGILRDMCCTHTHVIPAEDYVRHRLAVNRAIAEVVGDIKGSLLQSLASWKGLGCELPTSQAILFWLREAMPGEFEQVLALARGYALAPQEAAA